MQYTRLIHLRAELSAIDPPYEKWGEVTAWLARAKPIVRRYYPDEVPDLEKLGQPHWCALPRVGGTPQSEHYNNQARASELATNARIAREAKDSLLSLIDSLITLSEPDDQDKAKPHSTAMPKREAVTEPAMPAASPKGPTAFVSYSWDSEDHKQWALDIATRLRYEGVDAKLDRWDVSLGDPLPQFMETAVRTNNFVLIVLTPNYREKSDGRKGGVGYEGNVMTAEIFAGKDQRKFIPILREGSWDTASPSWLKGKFGVDLRGNPYSEEQFTDLRETLHGTRKKAPPLGTPPKVDSTRSRTQVGSPPPSTQAFAEPIRITNIITSEVGMPRNDGTRGSALYAVPFQLSRRPSPEWAEHFVRTWDNPPSWSTRHRPRIARVEGDRIILDGTTIEEVAEVHRDTLKEVIEKVNQDVAEHERRQRQFAEQEAEEHRRLKQSVDDLAKGLSFDDLSVEVRSLYYQDMDKDRGGLLVVTSTPRRFQAELGLTNQTGQTHFIKSITLKVAGRGYEREGSEVLRIEPREYKEVDETFPVNDGTAVQSGEFELEITPAVGSRIKVLGTFPVR